MVRIKQKTTWLKSRDINRRWYLLDMNGKILGREIPRIVKCLMGKYKVNYCENVDNGDHVIVVNASKVKFSDEKKLINKTYEHHTGYPGGKRVVILKNLMNKNPSKVVELAVKRMLPKNKLRNDFMGRLHVFNDGVHCYENHKPVSLDKLD